MDNLKNCPFCGEKAIVKGAKYNTLGMYGNSETEKHWYAVYCPKCKISQPKKTYFSKDDAVKAWNKRAEAEVKLETGWISVNDRLPEKATFALLFSVDGEVYYGSFGYSKFYAFDSSGIFAAFTAYEVSHWQYLPEPPEEVNEDDEP